MDVDDMEAGVAGVLRVISPQSWERFDLCRLSLRLCGGLLFFVSRPSLSLFTFRIYISLSSLYTSHSSSFTADFLNCHLAFLLHPTAFAAASPALSFQGRGRRVHSTP